MGWGPYNGELVVGRKHFSLSGPHSQVGTIRVLDLCRTDLYWGPWWIWGAITRVLSGGYWQGMSDKAGESFEWVGLVYMVMDVCVGMPCLIFTGLVVKVVRGVGCVVKAVRTMASLIVELGFVLLLVWVLIMCGGGGVDLVRWYEGWEVVQLLM